jgi:chemotaxis protein histidine kinase CheA
MTGPSDDFLKFLEDQRADYRRGLPQKLDNMEGLVALIGTDAAVDLVYLERLAHSMAGSGGTFGFDEVGDAAKALEMCVQRLRESGDAATEAQRDEVRAAVRDLRMKLPQA